MNVSYGHGPIASNRYITQDNWQFDDLEVYFYYWDDLSYAIDLFGHNLVAIWKIKPHKP